MIFWSFGSYLPKTKRRKYEMNQEKTYFYIEKKKKYQNDNERLEGRNTA